MYHNNPYSCSSKSVYIIITTTIKNKKMNKKPYSSYQRGITNYRAANLFDERFVLLLCVMYLKEKLVKAR